MGPPFPWNNTQPGYPQTPDGQYRYLRVLAAESAATGAVAGIRPWAPDYCINPPGIWEPMSLFTHAGAAKPALDAIQQALLQRPPHPAIGRSGNARLPALTVASRPGGIEE